MFHVKEYIEPTVKLLDYRLKDINKTITGNYNIIRVL